MPPQIRILFTEGFRFFFLAAGFLGFLAIGYWTLTFAAPNSIAALPSASSLQSWHAHEMIFGYGSAAIAGFFLTAVPNWTKGKMAKASFVTLLAVLWCVGRVGMLFVGYAPAWIVAFLDLMFVPVIATNIAIQLVKRPKPQNLMFIIILTVIWFSNLRIHLDWLGYSWGNEFAGLRAGLFGICAMIAVLGGRVTPAFTRNAMRQSGVTENLPKSYKALDVAGPVLAISLPFLILFEAPMHLTGIVAFAAGSIQFLRLVGWCGLWTINKPILWSLHLAYLMLALGFIVYGLSSIGVGSEVGAIHILAIGAVGGMTLAVMSRAALGHTGRPLIAPKLTAVAYGLIPVSALFRWLASTGTPLAPSYLLISGVIWCAALAFFSIRLWPVVTRPRLPKE